MEDNFQNQEVFEIRKLFFKFFKLLHFLSVIISLKLVCENIH